MMIAAGKEMMASKYPILHVLRRQPPHVRLLVNGTPLPVTEGRENVFQAIVLFLYLVQRDHAVRAVSAVSWNTIALITHTDPLCGRGTGHAE